MHGFGKKLGWPNSSTKNLNLPCGLFECSGTDISDRITARAVPKSAFEKVQALLTDLLCSHISLVPSL